MGYLTEELLKHSPFRYDGAEKKKGGMFYKSVMEELCFHFDNNPLYRSFCENKKFDPHVFDGELSEIPPVQVGVFKEMGRTLGSVPKENIKLTLQSSATSGVPSSVPIDSITSKRQAKAMVRVIGDYIGNERKPLLIMDVNPAEGFREILGARYAAVSGYLNFASKVGYFLRVGENGLYYFDVDEIQRFISMQNEPVIVFGFTYILYSEVVRPTSEKGISFQLPKGSKVIHIGGWKKLESEKVGKDKFNRMVAQLFGVAPDDVIDIYGFTEQMGLNYPDCPCGCKHAPLYSDVIVRDKATKEVLSAGQQGLLEFVSPVPHSYPGIAVLTDDIGMLVDGECEFGRDGRRFKVLGRLKKAEVRGCGDILSSKLKFAGDKEPDSDSGSEFKYFYNSSNEILSESADESIRKLGDLLKQNLSWIRMQPVDALIGLISQTAEKWRALSATVSDTQSQGLKFLADWCSPEHLVQIANEGLRGNRLCMDSFIPVAESGIRSIKATSRGLVCHWLAGNVQVLGMFVLVQSILTKNVNLLRVSSRDNGAFQSLLQAFSGEVFITRGGYTVRGDDLLKTIALVYYDHREHKAGKAMSEIADARIAWGGKEAVTTVASYPASFGCEDIIMGPKLSFSVISREALADERKAKKLARRVAVDASVFDQTGCASTHNVFAERNGGVSPERFSELLAEAMEKLSRQMPKGAMTPEEFAAIHSVRGVYDFKGKVFGDEDSVWTVLYNKAKELNKPVYSRVVFVHPVDDMNDTVIFVDDNIQTIGLAAEGERAKKYAVLAADRGAARFPVCGKMLNFESPWDGIYIMDRLVRWNTLGGPLV